MTAATAHATNPWDSDKPFSYEGTWISSRAIIKSMCRKVTGSETKGWQQYAMEKFLYPALTHAERYTPLELKATRHVFDTAKRPEDYRCLILGSNEGTVERQLCEWGFVGEIVASDIAENALARSRDRARALGYHNIRHVKADLNTDTFDSKFDFIIAEGVLHHITEIERCLRMLRSCLTDEGLLICPEFVGPFRFQLPDEQIAWINSVLAMMPQGLRPISSATDPHVPASNQQHLASSYSRAAEAQVKAFDPSEAISGHILKRALPELFEIVEKKDSGGTILTYLQGLLDYPKTNEPYFSDWMDIALNVEDTLIRNGVLDSDYVFYVARQRRC